MIEKYKKLNSLLNNYSRVWNLFKDDLSQTSDITELTKIICSFYEQKIDDECAKLAKVPKGTLIHGD